MVTGPPQEKKYTLRLWDKETHGDKHQKAKSGDKDAPEPKFEVSVMRITSVQADPGRSDIFRITYVDKSKLHQHLTLRRVDRSRDAWIELLQELIKSVRQKKEEDQNQSDSATGSSSNKEKKQ